MTPPRRRTYKVTPPSPSKPRNPPRKTVPVAPPAGFREPTENLGRQWNGSDSSSPKRSSRWHPGSMIKEVHEDGSFTTSSGSFYKHLGNGQYARQQSDTGATTLTAPKGEQKPFDNTVFVSSGDADAADLQHQRAGVPTHGKDGSLIGRYYNDAGLDKKHFMQLGQALGRRRTPEDFDKHYQQAGGSIVTRPISHSTTPQVGMHPFEWDH